MLCKLVEKPFDNPAYLFEQKLDGVRLIATKSGSVVKLWTRNRKDRTFQFPEVGDALKKLSGDFVLDGEAVVYDKRHNPSFQLIQPRVQQMNKSAVAQLIKTNPTVYCVFDILNLNGRNLIGEDLMRRKAILKKVVKNSAAVITLAYVETRGKQLFAAAKRKGWEGIIAKKKQSHYLPGKRGSNWQKIKAMNAQELVVGGFTKGYGKVADAFGALLVGYYQKGKLIFAGEVGTGYQMDERRRLRGQLNRIKVARSPFAQTPSVKEVTWVKPQLVAQIKFAEWTRDGILRVPVYLGLRLDKSAKQVRKE
jgi:bifunctional non-homologous end joining protein LigD